MANKHASLLPPRVRVTVRPLHVQQHVDAHISSSTLLDIVVQSLAPSPARFFHFQRTLHDFIQLEHELTHELDDDADRHANNALGSVNVASTITEHLTARNERVLSDTAHTANDTLAEARFAWQLEHALASALNHSALQVRGSCALHKFVTGSAALASAAYDAALNDLLEQPSADDGTAVCMTDRIPSGCTVEHGVAVDATDAPQLVVWQFTADGDDVAFAARFRALASDSADAATDPYSSVTDPYRMAAVAADAAEATCTIRQQHMAQYYTRVASRNAVVGHFVASASGAVVLEWRNTDVSSVKSKPLAFAVRVVPLAPVLLTHSVLLDNGDVDAVRARAEWLDSALAASTLESVDAILNPNDDDDDDDDGDSAAGGGSSALPADAMERLQEQSRFHEQRALDLDNRVAALERELRVANSDLERAHDELAVAGDVYRASLETIAELELRATTTTTGHQQQSVRPTETTTIDESRSTYDDSEPSDDSDDDSVESPVSAAQHKRVVALCTTFQEQCLWRAIELSESEKRRFALTADLEAAEQRLAALQQQAIADAETTARLEAENQTLRTHKRVLVREVKALQPFAQLNIAALVQETHEARMVQRSLQTQLDAMRSGNRSGVRAAAVADDDDDAAAADDDDDDDDDASGDDGEDVDDGAGGDFVVVESAHDSSAGRGGDAIASA